MYALNCPFEISIEPKRAIGMLASVKSRLNSTPYSARRCAVVASSSGTCAGGSDGPCGL